MAKAPAFQFYVQDFLVGTMLFSTIEIGAYILLLCHQWDNGFIPEDEIEFITRTNKENLIRVLKKFRKTDDGLQNERLEKTRDEQEQYRKKQKEKGKAGAAKRWGENSSGYAPAIENDSTGMKNDGSGHSSAMVLPLHNDSPSSSSSSSPSSFIDNYNQISADKIFEIMKQKAPKYYSDRLLEIKAKEIAKTAETKKINHLGAYVTEVLKKLTPDCKVKFYNPGAASYGYMQIEEWNKIKDRTALQFERYEAI